MTVDYADLGPDLLVESRGDVRVLTMNGPERLNSVDDALHASLRAVWERLEDDDGAGAAVLTGAGTAFCAGGHVQNFLRSHTDPAARRRDLRHAERLARAMIECEVPIVAAVNGPAVGLGASLAVMCDIVVMAEGAFLSDPHVNVGVVAGDGGAVAWPGLVGLLRAKEHLLLGTRLDAATCLSLGLANRVTRAGEALDAAIALAQQLADQPREALRDTKRALNMHLRASADNVLSFAIATERETFSSPAVAKTAELFLSKAPASST